MSVAEIDWLVARLRTVVTASPTVWAGRGMTLLQLTTLHLINALAPVTVTDLAHALGTKPPATSAMVDRLTHAGLVHSAPDPRDHRRVQLSLSPHAQSIIGETDPDTAHRMHAILSGIDQQTRRRLIDVLIDAVRRSAD